MFYTSKSIRLHNRCLAYLELIQKANNRHEDKRSTNQMYDDSFKWVKPMNYDYNKEYMGRMKVLSNWLIIRYQNVFTQLGEENLRQLRKEVAVQPLSTNEISTIEL